MSDNNVNNTALITVIIILFIFALVVGIGATVAGRKIYNQPYNVVSASANGTSANASKNLTSSKILNLSLIGKTHDNQNYYQDLSFLSLEGCGKTCFDNGDSCTSFNYNPTTNHCYLYNQPPIISSFNDNGQYYHYAKDISQLKFNTPYLSPYTNLPDNYYYQNNNLNIGTVNKLNYIPKSMNNHSYRTVISLQPITSSVAEKLYNLQHRDSNTITIKPFQKYLPPPLWSYSNGNSYVYFF